jgi:hypothetical protein
MADPPASDWSDLDLLTMAEARERLAREIAVVEGEIAAAERDTRADRLAALRHRLDRLQARLQQ